MLIKILSVVSGTNGGDWEMTTRCQEGTFENEGKYLSYHYTSEFSL